MSICVKVEKSELAKELEKTNPGMFNLYQHHPNDAGYDVKACLKESFPLHPGERVLIPCGIFLELSDENYEIQVRPRSGLAAKFGITVLNSPGTIDYGYRDEIKVILMNHSMSTYYVNPGERIAQICIRHVPQVTFENIEKISREVNRGGGFGSSGV